MHKLAIAAIMKNEAEYLDEWLCFHIIQGVTHFYLFDNGSTDNTRKLLEPYIKKGFVTLFTFPGLAMQLSAYATALNFYKHSTEWLAFLDCDEFLFNEKGLVTETLDSFKHAEQVLVQWEMFGSSGKLKKEEGLVISRFTRRAKDTNPHVKAIVRPQYVSIGKDPHAFAAEKSKTINVLGKAIDPVPLHLRPVTTPTLRLAHYFTKSKEEFAAKVARGRADTGTMRDFEKDFKDHDLNEVEDRALAAVRHEVLHKIKEIRGDS